MKHTITVLCVLWIVVSPNVMAQALSENEATPSAITENGARITITEVNFKNKDSDWAEIYYESPGGNAINLKGISFGDDHVFKKIETDFWLSSKQYATLIFKNDGADASPNLATTRSGLTGTTEQFILYDRNNNVLDAVCWRNSKPTTSEMSDQEKLYGQNGWISADINTCVDSDSVKTNESIIRTGMNDTNSANDWSITGTTTPGEQNITSQTTPDPSSADSPATAIPSNATPAQIQNAPVKEITSSALSETQSPTPAPLSLAVKPQTTAPKPQATSKPEPAATPAKTSGAAKKTSTSKAPVFKNGDLSNDVHISEILPNPESDDTKNEWIELVNTGEKDIGLGNWTLDDSEGGSKAYKIPDTTVIPAGSALLIPITESKLSLGNTNDSVRIFNFKNELVDSVDYENPKSGSSYARIAITDEQGVTAENWLWLKQPSPGEPNPSYLSITGTVTKEPSFEGNPGFEIHNPKDNAFEIHFSEDVIAGPFAKATFLKGAQIKVTLEPNDDATYQLRSFEVLSAGTEEQNSFPLLPGVLITTLCLGGTTGLWYWKKNSSAKSEDGTAIKTLFKTTPNG